MDVENWRDEYFGFSVLIYSIVKAIGATRNNYVLSSLSLPEWAKEQSHYRYIKIQKKEERLKLKN
jgi:hypothetical protein